MLHLIVFQDFLGQQNYRIIQLTLPIYSTFQVHMERTLDIKRGVCRYLIAKPIQEQRQKLRKQRSIESSQNELETIHLLLQLFFGQNSAHILEKKILSGRKMTIFFHKTHCFQTSERIFARRVKKNSKTIREMRAHCECTHTQSDLAVCSSIKAYTVKEEKNTDPQIGDSAKLLIASLTTSPEITDK